MENNNPPPIKRMTPETIEQLDSWKDNIKILTVLRNTLMMLIPKETETHCYSLVTYHEDIWYLFTRIVVQNEDGFIMMPIVYPSGQEGEAKPGEIFAMPKELYLAKYREFYGMSEGEMGV